MDHSLSSTSNQESRKPLCVEQARTAPEDLQEHMGPPLMVEEEEDKQLKSPLHPDPAFHEEYHQQDEGNYLPLCFSSFDFLKQRLKTSNQVQKMEVRNEVMALFKMDDGGREKMKYVVHPSFSFYEHTYEHSGPIHEEYSF